MKDSSSVDASNPDSMTICRKFTSDHGVCGLVKNKLNILQSTNFFLLWSWLCVKRLWLLLNSHFIVYWYFFLLFCVSPTCSWFLMCTISFLAGGIHAIRWTRLCIFCHWWEFNTFCLMFANTKKQRKVIHPHQSLVVIVSTSKYFFFIKTFVWPFAAQLVIMSSRKTATRRATTKKRAQRATSNVFAMFDQAQIAEFKVKIVSSFLKINWVKFIFGS